MDTWSEKFKTVKHWYFEYERQLIPLALLSGFLFDWFTVTRVDQLYGNLLLVVYMLIAAGAILIINVYDGGRLTAPVGDLNRERIIGWLRLGAPLVLQFAFGGLFSVFLVFYSRAGSFAVSWIFILLLVGLMIGNEMFRHYYERLSVQLSILLLSLFLFTIFFLPILTLEIGITMFLLSGIISLVLILLYFNLLKKLVPQRVQTNQTEALSAIVVIYILINAFYFFGVIPPLPLSVDTAEVVHSVERTNSGQYVVHDEVESLSDRTLEDWLWFVHDEIHIMPGESVYFFSSIFAPTDLSLNVVHHWQYYDTENNQWIDSSQISFPILGGRDNGYRGFSVKHNAFPGLWRVNIKAEDGRIIGRTTFRILRVSNTLDRPVITTKIW